MGVNKIIDVRYEEKSTIRCRKEYKYRLSNYAHEMTVFSIDYIENMPMHRVFEVLEQGPGYIYTVHREYGFIRRPYILMAISTSPPEMNTAYSSVVCFLGSYGHYNSLFTLYSIVTRVSGGYLGDQVSITLDSTRRYLLVTDLHTGKVMTRRPI